MQIMEITDDTGFVEFGEWLLRAESVHRQLRPQLMANYSEQMNRVFAGGGRMIIAAENETVLGLAVWRILEKTFSRSEIYIDDLVTDVQYRSNGVGRALINWCENRGRELECTQLTLDSGTPRHQAHKFYFREGFVVTSFHFGKSL